MKFNCTTCAALASRSTLRASLTRAKGTRTAGVCRPRCLAPDHEASIAHGGGEKQRPSIHQGWRARGPAPFFFFWVGRTESHEKEKEGRVCAGPLMMSAP